ncbi:LysR family transcriptional regulator [Marinobacterium nitratireducens]|uniref:LysR family transcriptional regulator n=1 Tax=Marinobacterium nitratireducens TaxID=518897 RepID=A0A917ZT72_9GAMM|nr:LysR family transcriptional regulator [Marinobacterium nitratireducens]GGO89506.1 LysR family transcriptional regulator [Marinobacterium nitratireducens]
MTDPYSPHDQLERFATRLDWNLLRTLVFIVQARSISRAAERLCLQQPTVSAALKRLEDAVGRRLIDRRPGHFELTPAGQKLYDEAMQVYRQVSRLTDLIHDAESDISGHVRILSISQIACDDFDSLLQRFFSQHPRVSLSIEVATTAEVVRAVENSTVTLGLCDTDVKAPLAQRRIGREQYAIYCSRSHRLYGREGLQLEDLRGEAYVGFTSDVLGGDYMGPVTAMRALASIGQQVRGASSNVEEVCRMVVAGIGIGALPVHLVHDQLAQGLLWQLPPYTDLPEADINLIYNPQSRFNDGERALIEALTSSLRDG